jgi:ligand-binding sensor domain-containing protein
LLKRSNNTLALKLSKYALLFVIIGLSLSSYGQRIPQYNIENITTEIYQLEKGISQNSVRCILEDRKGYIWFGTWDGLNRYDGTEFKYFQPSLYSPQTSLVQQSVNAILQDVHDNIWVGTDGGISKIDYQTFEITNFHLPKDFSSDTIHTLYQDDKGMIWAGTHRGIAFINPETDSIIPIQYFFNNADSIKAKEIRSIQKFDNAIWIATTEGLYKIGLQSYPKVRLQRIEGLSNNNINTMLNLHDSLLIIGAQDKLHLLHPKNLSVKHFTIQTQLNNAESNGVMALLMGDNNQLWIGTSGSGLVLFDLQSERFSQLKLNIESRGHQNDDRDFDPYIYSLYRSRSGIIWVGSAWNGVMKINEKQNIFKAFQKSKSKQNGLNDNHIWSFASDNAKIYIGTEGGLNIYDFRKHRFEYLQVKDGLSSNLIRSIYPDSEGNIWIGTFKGGLNYYNPTTKKNIIYSREGDSAHYISDNTVWTILEDSKNQVWFGTYYGLNCLDKSTGQMRTYLSSDADSNSLIDNTIYCSSIDSDGHIWFGTYEGLSEYRPETDDFVSYVNIPGDPQSLSMNRIFSIYDDQNGYLWLGTVGGGLNRFDKKKKTFKWYTTQDGLPNNVIYASIPDKLGNLWLSTNYGICKFNIETESVISYDANDGLLSNELNKGAAMVDNYGNIYFGGMFGFNVFNPEKIIQNTKIPKIVVSSLMAHDEPTRYDIVSGEKMELSYHQNDFSIRFAVLDFTNPQKNNYKYRLIGYDRDWITTTSMHPVADYSRVEPGRYEFQLMGGNNDGIWNPEPFIIKIIVRPPWYRHPIFIGGMLVLLVIIITLLIRGRINHIKNKHAVERQMFEMERQALRLQMNPHFIFNTLNSIQAFILKNKTKESIAYLSKFSRLMRAILNNSQNSIISFDQEIAMLDAYLELEQLRFEERFDYSIEVDNTIDREFLGLAPMLIQPYVENAVIHGVGPIKDRKGNVCISFTVNDQYLVCEIVDNGVGREYHKAKNSLKNKPHKSTGMNLTKSRLELLDQSSSDRTHMEVEDLYNPDGSPKGTRVVLFIVYEEI